MYKIELARRLFFSEKTESETTGWKARPIQPENLPFRNFERGKIGGPN
jgi:hypothetical protein